MQFIGNTKTAWPSHNELCKHPCFAFCCHWAALPCVCKVHSHVCRTVIQGLNPTSAVSAGIYQLLSLFEVSPFSVDAYIIQTPLCRWTVTLVILAVSLQCFNYVFGHSCNCPSKLNSFPTLLCLNMQVNLRFVFFLLMQVIRTTGFLKGLYAEAEMKSDNVKVIKLSRRVE